MTFPSQLGPFKPGDKFMRWEIRSLIGRGGHGYVYAGYDTLLNVDVAVKVMLKYADRALAEARLLTLMGDENVVRMHAVEVTDEFVVLVMEKLEGQDLRQVFLQHGPLLPHEMLPLLIQAAKGLAAAHKFKAIHRDIKPENIFVTPGNVVKVLDFGIAKAAEFGAKTTEKDRLIGTPLYMSPEQCQGAPASERSDGYALGLVAYEGMFGHPILIGMEDQHQIAIVHRQINHVPEPLHMLDPRIPLVVSKFVQHLITKKPEDRIPSAKRIADEAQEVLKRVLADTEYRDRAAVPRRDFSMRRELQSRVPAPAKPGVAPGAMSTESRGPVEVVHTVAVSQALTVQKALIGPPGTAGSVDPNGAGTLLGGIEGPGAVRPTLGSTGRVAQGSASGTPRITAAAPADSDAWMHWGVGSRGELVVYKRAQLNGNTLRSSLRQRGQLPYAEMLKIALAAGQVLAGAQRHGEAHGDIKPENIFVTANGKVVLLNFGLAAARIAGARNPEDTNYWLGTAEYLAPERVGNPALSERSDIYALGMVIYESLHAHPFAMDGRMPDAQEILRRQVAELPPLLNRVNPGIPEWVARFVECALVKNPAERFATFAELVRSGEAQLNRDLMSKVAPARAATPVPPAPERLEYAATEETGSMPPPPHLQAPQMQALQMQAPRLQGIGPLRSLERPEVAPSVAARSALPAHARYGKHAGSHITPSPTTQGAPQRVPVRLNSGLVLLAALVFGGLVGSLFLLTSGGSDTGRDQTTVGLTPQPQATSVDPSLGAEPAATPPVTATQPVNAAPPASAAPLSSPAPPASTASIAPGAAAVVTPPAQAVAERAASLREGAVAAVSAGTAPTRAPARQPLRQPIKPAVSKADVDEMEVNMQLLEKDMRAKKAPQSDGSEIVEPVWRSKARPASTSKH